MKNQAIPFDPKKPLISPHQLNLQRFFHFSHFNKMQTECLDTILKTPENMLVSAPTGSGKTVIFELAMIQEMKALSPHDQVPLIIYICPNKALSQEKVFYWKEKFEKVWADFQVQECTGDVNFDGFFKRKMPTSGLLIGTPEKVNYIFRNWKSHRKLINNLKLF